MGDKNKKKMNLILFFLPSIISAVFVCNEFGDEGYDAYRVGDLGYFKSTYSKRGCQERCRKTKECNAFAYDGYHCFTKHINISMELSELQFIGNKVQLYKCADEIAKDL